MAIRFIGVTSAALVLAAAWLWWAMPQAAAQGEKTESRLQAMLQLSGTFLPEGGFKITEAPTEGPGANLDLPNAAKATRGILEKGDIITEVEGKPFRDRREFLDLMNEAYRKNDGKVRITVKDVTTSLSVVWIARPEVVRMDVPVLNRAFDFMAELGKPVPAAPPVPKVPATINP